MANTVQDYQQQFDETRQRQPQGSGGSSGAGIGAPIAGYQLGDKLGLWGGAEAAAPVAEAAVGSTIPSSFGAAPAASSYTLGVPNVGGGAAMTATPAAEAAASPFSLSGVGATGNYILPAAGAVMAADLLQKRPGGMSGAAQGAVSGAMIGSYFPGLGTLVGAGVGALVGGLNKATGKDADQIQRDQYRAGLQAKGFLDQDFNVSLAKGGKYNVGIDGDSRPFNVDFNNPLSGMAVGWSQLLGNIIGGDNQKVASDFGGYLANAAMSDTDNVEGIRANILGFVQQMGLDKDKITQIISSMNVPADVKAAYMNGINTLFTGKGYSTVAPSPNGPVPGAPTTPAPSTTGVEGAVSNVIRNSAPAPAPAAPAPLTSNMVRAGLQEGSPGAVRPMAPTFFSPMQQQPQQQQGVVSKVMR